MKKCLIYIDKNNHKNSIDLIEVARQIYGNEAVETFGVSINNECSEAEGYFDNLFYILNDEIVDQDTKTIAEVLEEIHQKFDFHSILIPATHFGRMLAPRLAMKLKVGLTADVTAINHHDEVIEMVRPAFSGKIMAAIVKVGDGPIMLSVRQNVFHLNNFPNKDTALIDYQFEYTPKNDLKLLKSEEKEHSYDIRESDILVSGGGGTIKFFNKLQKLADVLDGDVSASRKIIDRRIASRSVQVGQSGKTVNPKLYIALGISGAIQHVEGLKNVEHIVTVNTNTSAPICSLSDMVVEGDAAEFIDKLVMRINRDI